MTLANPGDQSNFEGDLVNLGLSATDSAGHAIIYSATNLPAGLTIAPAAGIVSGKLYNGDSSSGAYSITVTATDSVNPSDSASQTFRWTVHPQVILANPGPQSNAAGDTVALQLHATNSAGNALQYNFTLGGTLPPGLTLNQTTGLISGTLSGMAPYGSPYTPVVTATDVTDSAATASQTFTWTIGTTGGTAVTLTNPGSQTNSEGDSVNWSLAATDSASNPLAYSAANLPTGLSINASTGQISGTIAAEDSYASPYTVAVSATDSVSGTIGATQYFQWTINPTITFPNPGAHTNADGDTIDWQLPASDSAGNALSFTATGLPSGLTIGTGGSIQGTVASNADTSSPYSVTVTVTDNIVSVSQTFAWTIDVTGGVTVTVANPGNQTDDEGDNVTIADSGSDSAGHALVFSASNLPPGMSINPTTARITGTIEPMASQGSVYQVVLTANDSVNPELGATTTFTWTVHPLVTPAGWVALSNNEGDTISVAMAATDSAGNALSYSATGLPSGLSINANTGVITGTLATGSSVNSPYQATITATDTTDSAATGTATITWHVYPGATIAVSVTNPGNQTNDEGDYVQQGVTATDSAGNALVYTATNLPPGLTMAPSSGVIWGTIQAGASAKGPYTVTVTAADSTNRDVAASQTFLWTVHPGITLTSPGNQSNAVGDTVNLAVQASDSVGGPFNYGAVGLPLGLAIDPTTGVISGTIAAGASSGSPYSVTVSATALGDGAASTTTSFQWAIAATGTVTVSLTNPGNQTNIDGAVVSLALSASDSANNPLVYSATGLPQGLFIDAATGVISGLIAANADNAGPYAVTVTAADCVNSDIAVAQAFTWTVNAGITVTLANPGGESSADGNTISIALSATDSAQNPLTYSVVGLPPGLSINASTGIISGAIASGADTGSPYSVTATATDSINTSVTMSKTFTWTVAASGTLTVTLSNPGSQTNADTDTVSLALSATDSASHSLTFAATGLPPGLSIAPATGVISGVIDLGATPPGTYSVTVTANDTVNLSAGATATFGWTVNKSATIMVYLKQPDQQADDDGDSVSVALSASDSAGNPVVFSAMGLPAGLSINSTTGTITGTISPGDDTSSPYTVTVKAMDSTDNSDSASQNFVWLVATQGGDVVTLAQPPNQSSGAGASVNLQLQARDSRGNPLVYTADGYPLGLDFNVNTGLFSGTIPPGAVAQSPYTVTVTAANALNPAVNATKTFTWTVTTNTLNGPTVVPGNSTYLYSFTPPAGAVNPQVTLAYPWPNTNPVGPGVASIAWSGYGARIMYGAQISFQNLPNVIIVNIAMQQGTSTVSWSQRVVIVQVTVGSGSFTASQLTAVFNSDASAVQITRMYVLVPAMQWTAGVTVTAPGTDQDAPSYIQVGFVQHVSWLQWHALYQDPDGVPFWRTFYRAAQGKALELQTYLDADAGQTWYSTLPGRTLFNPPGNASATIRAGDSPRRTWSITMPFYSTYRLWQASAENLLVLNVAAVTTQAPSDYWSEASQQWIWNGSGGLGSGTDWLFSPQAGVTAPTGGWILNTSPASVDTTGDTANAVTSSSQGEWIQQPPR